MSHPSTSKQYGGSAIKLKPDRKILVRTAAWTLLACVAAAGVVLLISAQWGEPLQHWFDRTFYESAERIVSEDGRILEVTVFRWELLKAVLLWGTVLMIALWGISLGAAMFWSGKRLRRELSAEVDALFADPHQEETGSFPQVGFKLRELEAAFHQKEQLIREEAARKDDLIAYLAHDLKTPLTSVIGYLELLEEIPEMPLEQRAKYTHIAGEKAVRLEHLINDFFEITRYNIHEILIEWEQIDISYLLIQMKEEFYPLLREHGNRLELHIPEGLTVVADREKLARVLNNLLKNAVAYSYPGTEITVSATEEEDLVCMVISNQGRTIPAQKLQLIFEKFYRLDDARSSRSGGSGLGLAIAKELVAAHGGTLTATSAHEVTAFRIMLPKNGESSETLKEVFRKSKGTQELPLL